MKSIINVSALLLFCCAFNGSAEEPFYDIFMGMLETSQNSELAFVKCGHKSSPMKFALAPDPDLKSINEAINAVADNIADNHKEKPIYIKAWANVDFLPSDAEYDYVIYVKSVDKITVGKSCHLIDYLQ